MTVSLEYIADCIRQAGCDPAAQLRGYLETGNACYITRTGDARKMITYFNKEQVKKFMRSFDDGK